MPSQLTIDGKDYTLVSQQRARTAVYRSSDAYLRIGPPDVIAANLAVHRLMEQAKFPVARILAEGRLDDRTYFVEEALGETYRMLFSREYERDGVVHDETFSHFAGIVGKFFTAQAATSATGDPGELARGIHLGIMQDELPQYASRIQARFDLALERMKALPYVLTHGDFNPSNIAQRGVLDLEDSFAAPLGFDIASALITIDWFPDAGDYEYEARWRFSAGQKTAYVRMFDAMFADRGFIGFTPYLQELAFCRALWLTARMHQWPKTQKWRYEKLVREYL